MSDLQSVAPILPTADLDRAVTHYRALGFEVEPYAGPGAAEGGGYAFATRGEVELHLSGVEGIDPRTSNVAVYLRVADADALHAEWVAAGVEGRFVEPYLTGYGLREGAHVDPDGNLVRFGSRPA